MIVGDSRAFAIDVIIDEDLSRESGHLWVWARPVVAGGVRFNSGGDCEQAVLLERAFDPAKWTTDRITFRAPAHMQPCDVVKMAHEVLADWEDKFSPEVNAMFTNSAILSNVQQLDNFACIVGLTDRGYSLFLSPVPTTASDDRTVYSELGWRVDVDFDYVPRLYQQIVEFVDRESQLRGLEVPWRDQG